MILPLKYYGDSVLRKKCLPIQKITEEIRQFAFDLIETMDKAHNGIGLAASQVGKLIRMFVIREPSIGAQGDLEFGDPVVYINPVLSEPSENEIILLEGCLSFPKFHVNVARPEKIHVEYTDLEGNRHEEEAVGFKARMIMHENDHLNGVLFIDRMDPAERKLVEPILSRLKKNLKRKMS
jgi:peptide deformylase